MAENKIKTGKRKTAIARVKLTEGNGKILVNKKDPTQYFGRKTLIKHALEPLEIIEKKDAYDISANIKGGGTAGQAGAMRLGIARALIEKDPELRTVLKKAGMLSRDSRIVERKKYGLHKARKATQFSKR